MLQIRGNLFETNSSSSCAFVTQISGYTIPKTLNFDTSVNEDNYDWNGEQIDGASLEYLRAERDGHTKDFLAYMGSKGVQKITVDGKPVDIPEFTGDNYYAGRKLNLLDGRIFGVYCRFHFAWEDDTPWNLREYEKDPDYYVDWDG